jgi:ornithine--oxo-acid transaminase
MSTGVKYDPSATTAPEPIRASGAELYAGYVNPQWARLLDVLQMNIGYARCSGDELETEDGRVILDFNSGYCVHNVGHNHPDVVAALKSELDRCGPAMLQAHVPDLAGELAARLCRLAGGRLTKAFFASSGSEGVEAAIKFARAHARRAKILCARGGFHGLTCGALSLMSNDFWKKGFGPLLAGVDFVDFGKLEDLESKLATKSFAAFILEPIQGEGGVLVPSREYLAHAQDLCRRHGTLLVLDEVQTGMHRTGPFIAAQHFGIEPDMVILAKALSGGLIPSGAVLMSDAIYSSVYGSLRRALIHTSTFGENSLAMRAGLSTLDILERENLGPRAASAGRYLRQALGERLAKYEMFGEVRGVGLLSGIEFKPPRSIKLRLAFEACAGIHPALFGQMIVMRMFRDHGILNQVCGNDFMVLKVSPPLTVENDRLDRYVDAIEQVMESVHGSGAFWAESLSIARRVIASI